MLKVIPYIASIILLAACYGKESQSDFEEMKPDLDEASEKYCECMIEADSSGDFRPEECTKILNEMLLKKCSSNEFAKEYVKEAIRGCIQKRSEMKKNNE